MYLRPLLLLISDGHLSPDDNWQSSAAALSREQAENRLSAFAFGVPGADLKVLSKFSLHPPLMLTDFLSRKARENWGSLTAWLSGSVREEIPATLDAPLVSMSLRGQSEKEKPHAAERGYGAPPPIEMYRPCPAPPIRKNKKSHKIRSVSVPVEQHRMGSILWSLPQRMRVGQRERVEVRLGDVGVAENQLREGLKGRGFPEIDILEIVPLMRVTLLSDAKDFEIIYLSSPDQYIQPSSVARWDFYATPLRSGTRILRILVSMRLTIESRNEVVDLPSYERAVIVTVSPFRVTAKFVSKHWQWLFATILIPLLGWAVTNTEAGVALLKQIISKP